MDVDESGEPSEAAAPAAETTSLSVRRFVAARIAEISSLTAQISAGPGGGSRTKGFSFQHVSKHMRRRAVSHNPKRLPSRLRASHIAQLRKSSGGIIKKPRRPRKKYRKRSEGDILEYNRRQLVNPKWLESHIWHAKRFHMKHAWERKVAYAPTAKCFRSLFRSARVGAIMQDVSYLATLELSGRLEAISTGLNHLIPTGFPKVPFWNREFVAHVYSSADTSTATYLGAIRYMWIDKAEQENIKLLVWAHPAVKVAFVDALVKEFELSETKAHFDFPEFPNKDEKKHLWKIATNETWADVTGRVQLKDLGGCFNRVRLVGPKSLVVLKQILKVGRLKFPERENDNQFETQEAVWKSVDKIINVPDNTVIPLNVTDPRRQLPDKRKSLMKQQQQQRPKTKVNSATAPFHIQWPAFNQTSPLWREEVRRWALKNKTSDHKLSRSRSKCLIPGTAISDDTEADVVPIALVFRTGRESMLGVDLILPCGWLMAFWIALSYRCVRVFALEFNDYLTFEENSFLLDFHTSSIFPPDAAPYSTESEKTDKEARTKYFSYPPAKRQNLIKLGCAFHFSTDWPCFLAYLSAQQSNQNPALLQVQVLRDPQQLEKLSGPIRDINSSDELFICKSHQLVAVNLMLLKGTVENGACICLPSAEDLSQLHSRQYPMDPIVQQPIKDLNEGKRAELSRQHHKRLSQLRKKRKVARRAAAGSRENKTFDLEGRLKELDSKQAVECYNRQMNSLWLNENPLEVLGKQSRELMGFTEYAHFSFVKGKSAAVGYVTLGQLRKLLELHANQPGKGGKVLPVLVRNWASTLTYHWARLFL